MSRLGFPELMVILLIIVVILLRGPTQQMVRTTGHCKQGLCQSE